jgi:hypothetical protein
MRVEGRHATSADDCVPAAAEIATPRAVTFRSAINSAIRSLDQPGNPKNFGEIVETGSTEIIKSSR